MHIDPTFSSPNYNDRPNGAASITALLLHSSEGTQASDIPWLCNPKSQVSCHYYINRHGVIYQLVPDDKRAWHAGPGTYAGISDWNSASIGIELEHKAGQGIYPQPQLDALEWLCRQKIAQYPIPLPHVAAHRWVAPRRKSDPTDWPDPQLKLWISLLYAYRVRGLPIHQDSDGTGAVTGILIPGDIVKIDMTYQEGTAHLADERGFVDMDGLEPV